MSNPITTRPIGFVRGGRVEAIDDAWDTVEARIELDAAQFGPDAALGFDAFSHAEVIFHFDRASAADVNTGARHPRGDIREPDWAGELMRDYW